MLEKILEMSEKVERLEDAGSMMWVDVVIKDKNKINLLIKAGGELWSHSKSHVSLYFKDENKDISLCIFTR